MPQPRRSDRTASPRLFLAGSLVAGFGLGGLVDGIVLHQILQWHNLVSGQVGNETLGGLRTNLFWDGVFHAATTAMLAVGVLLLWRAWERSRHSTGNLAALAGLVLIGWGVFHAVDQILFHEILDLHDIREGVPYAAAYNWGFFAVGLLLIAAGSLLYRTRGRIAPSAWGGEDIRRALNR